MVEGPDVPPEAGAEPGVVGNRHRGRAEILMEGTNGMGGCGGGGSVGGTCHAKEIPGSTTVSFGSGAGCDPKGCVV